MNAAAIVVAMDAVGVLSILIGVFILVLLVYLGWRYWWRRPVAPQPEMPPYPVIDEPPVDKHVRTPSDALSLLIGFIIVLIGLLFATGASNTLVGFERDLIGIFDALPEVVARILGISFIVVAALIPTGVGLVVLWQRRFRLLGMLLAAGLLGQFLLALLDEASVKRVGQPELLRAVNRPDWAKDVGSVDSAWIAGMVAVLVLGSPWISKPWRRAGWITVVVAVVFRAVTGADPPLDIVLAIGAGVMGGAAVLLIFGAPNKRPRGPAVVEAMTRAGVQLARLSRAGVDARSSTPYFADAEDGRSLFIKVLGRDERSADLMFRLYRFLRVKDVGDRGPFPSLQRMVEHEALVALYASDMQILTPRLVATAGAGEDGFLLAYERTSGESLDRVPDEAISDTVLRDIWSGVEALRSHRIAHRDLRLANVMLAPDGYPWLIDFGFAEIAATDQMLDTDVAELLSSTALKVGVTRAVDAAVAVLGKPAVACAAPRIQPLALSTATRKSLVARKPLCDELRKYAGAASDAGDVEPQDLQRVKLRTVLVFVSLAVAFYLLIPQLADVSGVWSKLKGADWTWALYALGASALTYVGATVGLLGAVPRRISFAGTFATQLGGSFVNRIVPARVGGIAINVRFLQKQGLELAVASSSVGLQQLSGLVMHIALSVIFLLWAGRSGVGAFHFLPSGQTVLIGLTVVLALSGLLFLLPAGRGVLRKRISPILKRSGHGVAEVATRPLKLVGLLGGSAILTLSYIAALVLSVHAFGIIDVSVASIGVVFLVGSAISSAAPTPGGIGAVEAALIAGLTALGIDRDTAVPAVFLYRIATFWLPIVPGWIAFLLLQRRGDL
jgi:glycosyltransferase 2 family protein